MAEAGGVTVADAVERLGLTVRAGDAGLGQVVRGAQVSDLLSYVMAQGKAGCFWITIQTHPNIVAVAALTGLSAIAVAAGFEPEEETIGRAEEESIPLLTSEQSAFVLAGKLYEMGVR
jgi:predicted transcriptional regulator